MFSSKKKKTTSNQTSSNSNFNILGEGTLIEGTINSKGSLRVDGEVNGTIRSESMLFIAPSAQITGDIHCENVEICGKVLGNIYSNGLVTVKETGNIKGDIEYTSIEIEPGAQLSCNLNQNKGKLEQVNSTQKPSTNKKEAKNATA